jgi:TetR/AcrR family fatty acid metabolism transcriptional regulator
VKQNKKELISYAAIEVISKEGFHSATTDKIAAEAGISVGLVYYYFKNKEEILEYIFEMECEKRSTLLKELKKSNLHPLAKIMKMVEHHFRIVAEDHKVAKIILRERHLPFCIPGGIGKIGGVPKFIREVVEEGVEAGQIRECNAEIMSIAIFGIIEEVLNRYILEKEEKQDSSLLDDSLQEIGELLEKGLVRI